MSHARIASVLRETEGLEADALGARILSDAVKRLGARAGVSEASCAELVAGDARARESLIADLLVHETSFFRYPASFGHLASFAVKRAAARPGPVRILSAACATGQEPLSAAIALLEAGLSPERVSVDAFDRSAAAIVAARAGRFERGGTRGLDAARASRWFEGHGGTLTVLREVANLVRFEVGSVLDAIRPFSGVVYDAVMCRNLLIYLTEPARRTALAALRAGLAPDGVLYLGHAEVLLARAAGFSPLAEPGTYACSAKPADVERPPTENAPREAPPRARPRAPAPPPPVAPPAGKGLATPTRSVFEEATALANAGRVAEACALLEAEAARSPLRADTFHLLALVRRAAGRTREADEALARALYLDPAHPGALLLAAVAAEGRGERGKAARLHARARAAGEGGADR